MIFQDEFVHRLRVERGEAADEGEDQDKPLLFSGGDTRGGGDAPASLASAIGGGADGSGLEPQQRLSDGRNHPNPSFEKEGLESAGDDGEHIRHPELVSGPRAAEPADRGKTDGVLSRQAIEDNRVQDDDSVRVQGDGGKNTRHCERSEAIQCGERRSGLPRRYAPRNDEGSDTVGPEPVEGCLSSEGRGSTGSPLTDTTTPAIRHDGWHPELRVKFLEALAQTGNVQASAYFVQRSRQSAYDLKRRDADFARAWLAALVLAREEAQDKLQERAIEGVEEEIFYHGEVVATRRRYDARLLLAHLARLDKIAEQIPAQRGAARFGDLLEAIGKGEDTAPLIATPTADELAALAGAAEAQQAPQAGAEEELEFYAVCGPDHDGPPDYFRMSPEEAAEMERDFPGLNATPTGTRDEAVINAMPCHAEAMREFWRDEAEKGIHL